MIRHYILSIVALFAALIVVHLTTAQPGAACTVSHCTSMPLLAKALPTPTATVVPTATLTPTATARPPTPQPAPECHPSYPDVCIPPPPPDLDCSDIPYRRFRVLPPDPHRFDGDGDGIGCERD